MTLGPEPLASLLVSKLATAGPWSRGPAGLRTPRGVYWAELGSCVRNKHLSMFTPHTLSQKLLLFI